jgi:hypothetical protein
LVSIVTPAYNHEKFIGACIESVLRQEYTHWEQIIIDDGSTDRTGDMVRRFSDPRIRYVHQANQGIEALAHTYNRALGMAQGSLIAILEGDDVWPAGKLSAQVPCFSDAAVVLAFGEEQDIDVAGRPASGSSRTSRRRRKLPRSVLFNDPVRSATVHLLSVEGLSFIPPSTVVLRRSALEEIGGFQYVPGICPTDIPTFLQLSRLGKFHYAKQVLGCRRRHLSSATLQFLQSMSTTPAKFILERAESSDLGLSQQQRDKIRKSWRGNTSAMEFTTGRMRLLDRKWGEARRHFSRAIRPGGPRILAAAAIGWALSWFHRDLEGLFQLAGRAPLKSSD